MDAKTFANILQRAYYNKPAFDIKLAERLSCFNGDLRSDNGIFIEGRTQEYKININLEPVDYDYSECEIDDPDDPRFVLPELEPCLWVVYGTLELYANNGPDTVPELLFSVQALGSSERYAAQRALCAIANYIRKTDMLALDRICSINPKNCRWHTGGYCH